MTYYCRLFIVNETGMEGIYKWNACNMQTCCLRSTEKTEMNMYGKKKIVSFTLEKGA